ncbi:MAG: hypothetical protein JKY52_19320 [Flavobacteriales bacterium]|nr:hypothetical protein [Flavobacteriales bacterium]
MSAVESRGLLEAPERHVNIPENAQWLGGVGAGSWFCLLFYETMSKFQYRIQRFAVSGEKECDSLFYLEDDVLDANLPYQFTYLSHCQKCTILQGDREFILEAIRYPTD